MTDSILTLETKKIRVSLAAIFPGRKVKDPEKTVPRFKTIRASIKEVGLVEPLTVRQRKGEAGAYLLLDCHLRLLALKELGETEVDCVIVNDDESFTL
jgi:ParB-like chromosome segregation protein Spo0J